MRKTIWTLIAVLSFLAVLFAPANTPNEIKWPVIGLAMLVIWTPWLLDAYQYWKLRQKIKEVAKEVYAPSKNINPSINGHHHEK